MSDEPIKETSPPEGGKSKTRPVYVYLIVLFLAALLLLLMSFFMQQRNHQALMDLNNSVTASQDITELQMANQQLEFQLGNLKRQAADLEKQVSHLESAAEDARKQAEALEWLRQIEAATRSSASRTQELVMAFQETDLEKYLPDESVVEGGTSPAETYRNIYAMIF